jgi:coenzyme F420-0:L-glutamate ligase/coenzyme F420-1:gamma-L-glutamate ligase
MISILPVHGLPEIREGDDLAALVTDRIRLEDRDVLVLAQKVVSKAEGRIVRIDTIEASAKAVELAADERDPREIEVILREAKRIVRERGPLVIAETQHGFVCASAGVDHSNAPEPGTLVLLPVDPDASALAVRARILELTGTDVGVVVTDSFGRPFRQGTTDVAIGAAGITPILDLRGTTDRIGYELRSSRVAVADEIAAAADLARGKAEGIPACASRATARRGRS